MLFQRPPYISLIFWILLFLFFGAVLNQHFLFSYLVNHWLNHLLHLICCWLLMVYSSLQLLYSALWLLFFWFLSLFLCFLSFCWDLIKLIYSFSRFVDYPYNQYFELCIWQVACLYFSGDLTCSFIWDMFLFLLTLDAFLYLLYGLGRTAMSPTLGRVALCGRCPVEPSGAPYSVTQMGHSRCTPMWAMCMFCCSWGLIAAGTSMRWIYSKAICWEGWPQLQWKSCCARFTPWSRSHLSGALVSIDSALWVRYSGRWLTGAPAWSKAVH